MSHAVGSGMAIVVERTPTASRRADPGLASMRTARTSAMPPCPGRTFEPIYSAFNDAMSIEKRYFTSERSIRS